MSLPVPVSSRIFRDLRGDLNNKRCFDCPGKNPQWCSVPFGIWLCVDCASVHRRMGTHISFVRSSILDRWTPDQIMGMMVGGNRKACTYFKQHGWMEENAEKRTAKFTSKAAVQYKRQIQNLKSQQRMSLLAQINAKPEKKAAPKLPSGLDGLDALMGEIKDEKAKAGSRYAVKKHLPISKPKPQVPQNSKSISPSLQTKIKPQAPARRVIITKKSKERKTKTIMRSGRSKANPRKSRLTTNLSTSSRRKKLTVSRMTSSHEDDLDAALDSLKLPTPAATQVKPKVEVKPKPDERKLYEEEQKQREIEENRRKDDSRLSKYNNSKSISSDQYFERGDWAATSLQDKMRLEKFSSANSIGSDAFFDREQESRRSASYDAISTVLSQKTKDLGGYASGFYNSVKARYNQSG